MSLLKFIGLCACVAAPFLLLAALIGWALAALIGWSWGFASFISLLGIFLLMETCELLGVAAFGIKRLARFLSRDPR